MKYRKGNDIMVDDNPNHANIYERHGWKKVDDKPKKQAPKTEKGKKGAK